MSECVTTARTTLLATAGVSARPPSARPTVNGSQVATVGVNSHLDSPARRDRPLFRLCCCSLPRAAQRQIPAHSCSAGAERSPDDSDDLCAMRACRTIRVPTCGCSSAGVLSRFRMVPSTAVDVRVPYRLRGSCRGVKTTTRHIHSTHIGGATHALP